MKLFFGLVLVVSGSIGFAGEKCAQSLQVIAPFEITTAYTGYVYKYDYVEEDQNPEVMPKGDYVLTADLELTKERKSRCEYDATNLEITGDKKFRWKTKKTVKARVELDAKGSFDRFHLNNFTPSARKTLTLLSGKKTRLKVEGKRPLYFATTYYGMDDTSVEFKGDVAYFDYSDGHEYFGKVTAELSQD